MRKKIVVLSGAGISAESGLKTFRDSDGLWENYRIEEVATPEAFKNNPALVLQFYNERRDSILATQPNPAHLALVELESQYEVSIITQNIDDLHERAGSTAVLHLHGEITKVRSCNPVKPLYYPYNEPLQVGQVGEDGYQLRPHIVWFGEPVPMIEKAATIVCTADIVLVIGTSLNVYPAAGLLQYTPYNKPIYVIDKKIPAVGAYPNLYKFEQIASIGVKQVVDLLLKGK